MAAETAAEKKKREARERAARAKKTPAAKTRGNINVNARKLYLDVDNAEGYSRRGK